MEAISNEELRHFYDPVKAHAYYVRTRQLKGRKKGRGEKASTGGLGRLGISSLLAGPGGAKPSKQAQKEKLDKQISQLSQTLTKLNAELKKRMAKQREAAKEAAKPDTAAEKRKAAERSKDWRAKNQQKVKNQNAKRAAKESKGDSKTKGEGDDSIETLKASISKVKDALTAAKARRRALG